MKTSLSHISPLFVLALSVVACGGGTPPPDGPDQSPTSTVTATPPPSATPEAKPESTGEAKPEVKPEAKKEEPPPPAKKSAKEIIEMGGTYMFSLADSADAKKLASDDCEAKSKKDAKKLEACLKDVDAAAAVEGIRFEKDAKGGWVWVSFGKEKDKEVIYIKSAFKIAKEDGAKITVTPEGKAEGKMAGKGPAPKEMSFEIPDEGTVKLTDPMGKKGVLVYKKK